MKKVPNLKVFFLNGTMKPQEAVLRKTLMFRNVSLNTASLVETSLMPPL